MYSIWKYEITIKDDIEIEMPLGAKPLSFQLQNNIPTLWCYVNTEAEIETKLFKLIGTGHPIDRSNLNYIGTIQMFNGGLVYHLFEK